MSTLSGYVKAAAVGALGQLADVFLSTKSSIAYIIPQVVIREEHTDEAEITDQPIETGAPVSDHVYDLPAEVVMTVGWSSSASIFDASGTANSVDDAYAALLDLKALREPFSVTTSKRQYENMLIRRMSTVTDKTTNAVLQIEVGMRQVFIVDTQTTNIAPKLQQQEPQKTAGSIDTGAKQVVPAKTSVLAEIRNALNEDL